MVSSYLFVKKDMRNMIINLYKEEGYKMLSELFGMLSSVDVGNAKGRFDINLNKRRIKSISSFSSNSIFYFPLVVSDQCTLEEVTMISRALEKQYASFVVACISLMPFHRIRSDDQASVEEYLRQFHQNMGINSGNGLDKALGMIRTIEDLSESAVPDEARRFYEYLWRESQRTNTNPVIHLRENYESLQELFNEEALDRYTKILVDRADRINEEMSEWGFIGMDPPDDFDESFDLISYSADMNEGAIQTAMAAIKFKLESVPDNKIKSCPSLSKLRSLESKLNTLKSKYAKYLKRYKKKHKENKDSNSKLKIRFQGLSIDDPKAFMQQYGSYIRTINRKLKLVETRRNELRSKKGLSESSEGWDDFDLFSLDSLIESIQYELNASDSEIFFINEDYENDDTWELNLRNERLSKSIVQMTKLKDDEQKAKQSAIREAKKQKEGRVKAEQERDSMKTERSRAIHQANRYRDENQDLKQQIKNFDFSRSENPNQVDGDNQIPGGVDIYYNSKFPDNPDPGRFHGPGDNIVAGRARKGDEFKPFGDKVFTDMEMKKANDMIPTFTKASIGFIVDNTETVVTRDVLIGIKTYVHKAPTAELINDLYTSIISKRKFLKFIKFVTGEEKSLSDLLFGIQELKTDALSGQTKSTKWKAAFQRRKRWQKMSIPFLMREYTPNGTIVITMNEVDYIRDNYGIDLMKSGHIKMLMDQNFLLGFAILDQSNELVYVMYDGHNYQFQEYSYNQLEREQQTTDRMMRELYRSFGRA